jgi:hypothetical protein
MKSFILKVIFLVSIFFNICAINPNDLIKVTGQAEQACVEYYTYQGDLYCSTKVLSPQASDPEIRHFERQKIVFDQRPWQFAWGKKTDQITTVEYVPLGDDVNDWKELITSQYFPGIQNKITPKEFAERMMSGLKKAGYQPIVTFIKETPDTVIFEFRVDSPKNQAQDELQKIVKGKDGIYVLHYVIKKEDMGAEARSSWVKNLSDSEIK